MPAPSRPYHHGNLREALLDAADQAVEVGGAQKLTLRELSRTLAVSHSSPRRHFADKQALLDALAVRGFERLGTALRRATRDRAHGFDRRLADLAQAHIAFAVERPRLFALMFDAKQRGDASPAVIAASEEAFAPAATVFRDGQADGSVVAGDPERLGLVCFAVMQGLIAMTSADSIKNLPLGEVVAEVVERLILGLRPRG